MYVGVGWWKHKLHRRYEMTLKDYEGKTFVAYVDISGFKELMKDKEEEVEF